MLMTQEQQANRRGPKYVHFITKISEILILMSFLMQCQNIVPRCLCLIEKDQINCPKFGHVEIKIVPDSDSDKTVKVWVHVFILRDRV